jgi:hypothetical protein
MEYVGTISKLKKELEMMKEELAEKAMQEELLKHHTKRLEEGGKMLVMQAKVRKKV